MTDRGQGDVEADMGTSWYAEGTLTPPKRPLVETATLPDPGPGGQIPPLGGSIATMLRIGTVVLGVDDVRRAVDFWAQALDYVPRDDVEDDWAVMVPASGRGTHLALGLSETPVQTEPRVHLDLYADDAADQAAEVDRLLSIGAQRVEWHRYPDDADFVVLADLDGNRFCVIDKSHG